MSVVINGSAGVTVNSGAVLGITSATAVASTSGTSIDFTSIPSWVKRITVMLSGVSTSGTSLVQIQIGSGSVTTTGYSAQASYISGASLSNSVYSSGFVILNSVSASLAYGGAATLCLLGSNTWCESSSLGIASGANGQFFSAGSIALGGTLDRVRITTVNGTDTFDAGSINILYE
jgi:hypothetical protein